MDLLEVKIGDENNLLKDTSFKNLKKKIENYEGLFLRINNYLIKLSIKVPFLKKQEVELEVYENDFQSFQLGYVSVHDILEPSNVGRIEGKGLIKKYSDKYTMYEKLNREIVSTFQH